MVSVNKKLIPEWGLVLWAQRINYGNILGNFASQNRDGDALYAFN